LGIRAGFTVEHSLLQIKNETKAQKIEDFLSDDTADAVKRCIENPSLGLRILLLHRSKTIQNFRLQSKQARVVLQAKAQAATCGVLYLVIFIFQWFWNDDFQLFLKYPGGKLILVSSGTLLLLGIHFVFRLSKYREAEL
jgi:hypothetical protein